jgi:hypothetical protein
VTGQTDIQGQVESACVCVYIYVCVSLSLSWMYFAIYTSIHTLLANHVGILIVGIVGVAQLAIRLYLKLHELVPKFACVSHAVCMYCEGVYVCVCVDKYQLRGREREGEEGEVIYTY